MTEFGYKIALELVIEAQLGSSVPPQYDVVQYVVR
ncbi:hypothetical protein EYZ11_005335 [Aspergillus tanneri]|uniref:Uncharacterized protein n=1 Tax=Aspergillus tanneri TaxID=1220188 RepID=A0A4S3JI46_9EURO|nr:hypothetical protein EYZ11_005335 [Aspergillus tanneri]